MCKFKKIMKKAIKKFKKAYNTQKDLKIYEININASIIKYLSDKISKR